ncbi:MAG TPA: FAD-linked oxidase C-terminal domain-containing protein [Myxococcales bacterium]
MAKALGEKKLLRDADRLEDYSKDESDTGLFAPDVVAFAESTEDVQAVMRLCSAHHVPVTPCAARTGKSGGSVPIHGGVALSTERMAKIKEIAVEDLVCVVEPGVVTETLMKAVEEKGLFYPPDPNSLDMCTLGGNVAENAGGPRALKYGVTRDYVLGLELVLPSGELIRMGKRTIKGVAGYDLTSLIVGSEGTLGIITEITLQLIPLPREVVTALITFETLDGAAKAITAVLAAGILPRTLELMDEMSVKAVDGKGFHFPGGTKAAVIFEVDGDAQEPLFEEMGRAAEISEGFGVKETLVAQNEAQRRDLWSARRQVSTALRQIKPLKVSDDIAVPRSKIPAMIERIHQLGREHDVLVATYGHAGDGNLHANFLYQTESERKRVDEAVGKMLRECIAMGGTITGEHGVGIAKKEFLPLEQSAALIELQRKLKKVFDPQGILNPGKIFD